MKEAHERVKVSALIWGGSFNHQQSPRKQRAAAVPSTYRKGQFPQPRGQQTLTTTRWETRAHTHTHMCCICLLGGLHHLNNLNHTFQCNLNGCCTGACSVCRTRFLSKSPKFFVFLFVYKVLPWQWPIHPSIFCYPHLPNQAQGGSGTHPDGAFLGSRYKISHRKLLTEPICLDLFLRAGMQPTLLKPRCVWGQQCQRELC